MILPRPTRPLPVITLAPLIDIFMILLIFFVVTSTFMDLDMIPMSDGEGGASAAPQAPGGTLLVRIAPDGTAAIGGARMTTGEVSAALAGALQASAGSRVLILPAPTARMQALVEVLEAAAQLGVDARIVRLGGG